MAGLGNSPLSFKTRTDMCALAMMSSDKDGSGPVLKPTTIMANSIELSIALDKVCKGCKRHLRLVSGQAAAAQVYPKALCRAIVEGIIK